MRYLSYDKIIRILESLYGNTMSALIEWMVIYQMGFLQ